MSLTSSAETMRIECAVITPYLTFSVRPGLSLDNEHSAGFLGTPVFDYLFGAFQRSCKRQIRSGAEFLRPDSVPRLSNYGGRAAAVEQELAKLGVDVLVRAPDQKLHVFDDVEHDLGCPERLRRDARPIAVVNAVVAALNDCFKPVLHPLPRGV